MKLAVFFPGIGYHCDKPLLYYAKKLTQQCRYEECISLSYSYDGGNIRGNQQKMQQAFEALYAQAEEKLAAHTTNGSIHFEEIDARDIQLKTSNASIKGTLRGKSTEYAIESGTSNGKNSLPSKWNQSDSAAKRLSVHTSNANIKVAFEEM